MGGSHGRLHVGGQSGGGGAGTRQDGVAVHAPPPAHACGGGPPPAGIPTVQARTDYCGNGSSSSIRRSFSSAALRWPSLYLYPSRYLARMLIT